LKVFESDETNCAVLERVLHGIILSDEAVHRGTSLFSLVDELLLLTLVFFAGLIPLLDEGIFTTPLCMLFDTAGKKTCGRVVEP
jgi:hypothetical protein